MCVHTHTDPAYHPAPPFNPHHLSLHTTLTVHNFPQHTQSPGKHSSPSPTALLQF